ncbi:unnamed protein product [Protopolystoma xenopodis]|uniref:Uncharacterized protein n=1 Tax=Protopolystoma xenopodis TaxID=117903 RepID=A0A3S5AHJ8_9PLAT|nr:unnamed protein product [Protopolystoma xenopodis]
MNLSDSLSGMHLETSSLKSPHLESNKLICASEASLGLRRNEQAIQRSSLPGPSEPVNSWASSSKSSQPGLNSQIGLCLHDFSCLVEVIPCDSSFDPFCPNSSPDDEKSESRVSQPKLPSLMTHSEHLATYDCASPDLEVSAFSRSHESPGPAGIDSHHTLVSHVSFSSPYASYAEVQSGPQTDPSSVPSDDQTFLSVSSTSQPSWLESSRLICKASSSNQNDPQFSSDSVARSKSSASSDSPSAIQKNLVVSPLVIHASYMSCTQIT